MVKLLTLLAAAFAAVTVAALNALNQFAEIGPDKMGRCVPVTGIVGPEDLQVDPIKRRLFVASLDKRAGRGARGSVHVIDIDDPLASAGWHDRTGGFPKELQPVGLHYYEGEGVRRLFVVNDAAKSIEAYDVADDGELSHVETFKERRLTSPNDVVAVGARDFYVTNDASAGRASLIGRLQFLGRAPSGSLLHFNGVAWSLVDEGLRFANGVAVSPDGRSLVVAESAAMTVRLYERDPQTGVARATAVAELPGSGDNLNVAANGALLVAANPKPLSIALHRRTAEATSPSMILRSTDPFWSAQSPPDFETVFQSDGEVLSAATAADFLGGSLFIGALADDRFLICAPAS
ncbi:MAG: SMP-30/gluconolactonase/LRE family protein [Pseudomonadota bacterium]